jgi:WD40 repeat protein
MTRRTLTQLFALSPLLAADVRREPIYSLAFSPDGKAVALGGWQQVRLREGTVDKPALAGHADAVRAVAWSPNGQLLAAAGGAPGRKGEVKIWKSDGTLATTITGHNDCIYAAVFSPDGTLLATASYDKLIKLWDPATGNEVRTLKDHIDAIYGLAWSADGKRLVSGAADRSIKVWNPATGERLYTMSEPADAVLTVALSPDGNRIAAAGQDKTIRIWRIDDKGPTLQATMIAHEDAILRILFTRDGRSLISSSADRTLKLFRASDLTELKMLGKQSDWAYGLDLSPDGRRLAIGRMDGSFNLTEFVP